jgi:hypothetical protein
MTELAIEDKTYRTGKLDAKTQFHIVRRLLPLVSSIGTLSADRLDMTNMVTAFADAISKLSDEDCDYVLAKALSVCQRKEGQAWAPVWNRSADRMQYDDIDLVVMMQLTVAVLQENLGGFFPALPIPSPDEQPRPSAPLN